MAVKIKTTKKYKDRETGKVYEAGSTRTVSDEARAEEIVQAGYAQYLRRERQPVETDGVA